MKAVTGFSISGLNHLGLVVEDMTLARRWFVETLGLRVIEDRGELLFIMAGADVLAIKTPRMAVSKPEHGGEAAQDFSRKGGWQTLDHYGFFCRNSSRSRCLCRARASAWRDNSQRPLRQTRWAQRLFSRPVRERRRISIFFACLGSVQSSQFHRGRQPKRYFWRPHAA